MPADMMVRLARSAVFAVGCAGLASAAHLLAGGMVTAQTFAAALAVGLVIGFPATGRERPFAVIMTLLAAGQVVSHLLFTSAYRDLVLDAHTGHGDLSQGVGMVLVHAVATLLTAWWLDRGEVALWALLRQVAAHVVWYVYRHTVPVVWAQPGPVAPERTPAEAVPLWLSHAVVRRGPPHA
ncbi:hypothetical protein GCM10022224_058310 [Nonomuraea antimicrobica]|uniref:MFS transporter n=1 Tax=Nonomuraea antimicrobica TaxID=561173 RepID=A0ABP7CBB2_9ACTN